MLHEQHEFPRKKNEQSILPLLFYVTRSDELLVLNIILDESVVNFTKGTMDCRLHFYFEIFLFHTFNVLFPI